MPGELATKYPGTAAFLAIHIGREEKRLKDLRDEAKRVALAIQILEYNLERDRRALERYQPAQPAVS